MIPWHEIMHIILLVSERGPMGSAPYFRVRQGGGPTFMTSIVQLYVKIHPGLHRLQRGL